MSATKVSIFNRSFAILGGSSRGLMISTEDDSDQASWCREFFDDAVDYVVTHKNWREAKEFAVLSETGDTIEKAEWDVAYTRPVDCLKILRFTDIADQTRNYPYAEMRKYILSNETTGYLHYIRNMSLSDVTQMSVHMRMAIAARLAYELAPVFKPNMQQAAQEAYEVALVRAEEMNSESVFVKDSDTSLVDID